MLISLVEWARENGIDPATARQRAGRGAFQTAVKIGRNWLIDEDEKLVDHRANGLSKRRQSIMEIEDVRKLNKRYQILSDEDIQKVLDDYKDAEARRFGKSKKRINVMLTYEEMEFLERAYADELYGGCKDINEVIANMFYTKLREDMES